MTDYALISKYNYQISPASTFREKLSTSMWEITSLATFRDISFTRLGVGRDVTMLYVAPQIPDRGIRSGKMQQHHWFLKSHTGEIDGQRKQDFILS